MTDSKILPREGATKDDECPQQSPVTSTCQGYGKQANACGWGYKAARDSNVGSNMHDPPEDDPSCRPRRMLRDAVGPKVGRTTTRHLPRGRMGQQQVH